jgi:hypothetical protein
MDQLITLNLFKCWLTCIIEASERDAEEEIVSEQFAYTKKTH